MSYSPVRQETETKMPRLSVEKMADAIRAGMQRDRREKAHQQFSERSVYLERKKKRTTSVRTQKESVERHEPRDRVRIQFADLVAKHVH